MTNHTIVYSAVTADYDKVFKPRFTTDNVEYILFMDHPSKITGWNVRQLDTTKSNHNVLNNRWYKFFAHEVFTDVEYSIYIDGNIRIIGDLTPLIQEFKESGAALGVFKHLDRSTISEEMNACFKYNKFDPQDELQIKSQLETYYKAGMPHEQLLSDNAVIFRWHKHPKLAESMNCWWEQLQTYSKRDQISLPYVIWKNELPVKRWAWSFRKKNEYFEPYPHRSSLFGNLITHIRVYRNESRILNAIYTFMKKIHKLFSK